ncbi:DNA-binding response regulator [Corallococcus sp. H22C18031201]|uniref:response regulator n=1 Tax=Citreicoccus inhibens TaxID=2849499 RepID=UPI000E7654BF|nr:response regulator transcription factor [Citreicoccus inhibens]RJS19253.1 DNA-binding response regulator [Corallococcus sp. H22C18031201]
MSASSHRASHPDVPPASSAPESSAREAPGWVLRVGSASAGTSELASALVAAGFATVEVEGLRDALVLLLGEGPLPGFVVVDTELVDGDGFSLCGQLRAEARTAHVPVLLLARREEEFHRDLAGGVGADDYLAEPLVADVVALARLRAGHRSADAACTSDTSLLPLTHVARALLAGVRSGRVALTDGDGWFAFRHGLLVDAAFHGERGSQAFRRLLCFGAGAYAVVFGPELHKGSFTMDRAFLCEQVLPGLARFDVLRARGLPLAARLTVDFARLARHLPTLPEDVGEVVRLFDGRRTLRAMLLDCRFPEAVAYEAATRLFMLGVLVPACFVEERERVLPGAEAPRLFEPESPEPAGS